MSQRSTAYYHTDTPFCTQQKSHITWNFAVPVPHSEEIRQCILLFLCTLACMHCILLLQSRECLHEDHFNVLSLCLWTWDLDLFPFSLSYIGRTRRLRISIPGECWCVSAGMRCFATASSRGWNSSSEVIVETRRLYVHRLISPKVKAALFRQPGAESWPYLRASWCGWQSPRPSLI